MRERNVVFVVNAAIVGGAELHAAALCRGLNARGFSTRTYALSDGEGGLRRRLEALRSLLGEPGLVVAVNERPAALAVLAGFRRKARVAAILHSTLPRNRAEGWLRIAHLPALYALDRIVFVSERQRAHWRRYGVWGRDETIRNGVDTQRFAPETRPAVRRDMRASLGFSDKDVVAVFCAVLRPEKNASQFLDALALQRARGAPLKGLIVGDGPCGPEMRARISALGLTGAVALAGMREDVRPYLAAADFGVNCSLAIETLSLAALETLAMGLPMLMSDIGGAAEIVDDRNGALFPPGDVPAMAAAIAGFLDPRRRAQAGLAARARAVGEFDEAIMFDRYAQSFSRLLGA